MDNLSIALNEFGKTDFYPFHMPGHKRVAIDELLREPYREDITEIENFDNLHHPEGIIKSEQENAAKLFGAEESFFLVNGSSCGVLAAIGAVASGGQKRILMARNAHKSAYNALYLAGAEADFVYPQQIDGLSFAGEVCPEDIEKALCGCTTYDAVFLTSPTYEGVVSDVKAICEVSHQRGIPVIVDEAHGAHLGLWGNDGFFPTGALSQGADIVIESLHKTLPAMTQTAILHVQGSRVDRSRLKQQLAMFQSSSPSYILMSSISSCLRFCREEGAGRVQAYKERLCAFYRRMERLQSLELLTPEKIKEKSGDRKKPLMDPGKIIIGIGRSGFTGKQLYDRLRQTYHLQMEMAAASYVIAMTSIMDTNEGFDRLAAALEELDVIREEAATEGKGIQTKECMPDTDGANAVEPVKSVYSIRQALEKRRAVFDFEESAGLISGEFVYLYPPGIPLIVPGEIIDKEILASVIKAGENGLSVQGPEDYEHGKIWCVTETEW